MKKQRLILLFVCFASLLSYGQDGSLDTSFGDNGFVYEPIVINDDGEFVSSSTLSDSGNIFVCGVSREVDFSFVFNFIIKYLEDGTLDDSFGDNGFLLNPNSEIEYKRIVSQSDDKLILWSTNVGVNEISRLTVAGEVDTTFGVDGYIFPFNADEFGRSLSVNDDDSILFFGTKIVNNMRTIFIKKYLSNGQIDTTYGVNGVQDYPLGDENLITIIGSSIKKIGDNKLIVTYKHNSSNSPINRIARFMPDGALDKTFGVNGKSIIPIDDLFSCSASSFEDGSLLVGCSYWDQNNDELVKKTLKLNSQGNQVEAFGDAGFIDGAAGGIIQENQRILADFIYIDFEGGISPSYRRYFSNGVLDTSFQFSYQNDELGSLSTKITNDGKILLVGNTIWYNGPETIILSRYNNDVLGTPDQTQTNFSIYPNPSSGKFTITFEALNKNLDYQVLDALGGLIKKGGFDALTNNLDLSNASSGMYFLKIGGSSFKLLKK